ncbi:PilZ domain-containing protein [Desulforamulus ferrireducens]|uniref:PilZ domain-containing protein n=1 Tax=Desulforamulus ferrireducens TaxID=1833852 RepID=A0A1S6IYE7_9FIRM|nr:PilZ domain-containing protein [Desulforamulus ferrireducens]AQS59792.1 hypothetical protein B0537_12305 [Desulforamulus ferrireducens]
MKVTIDKERRKYTRINIELPLSYELNSRVVNCKTINVSACGAFFFTPQRLTVGQEIDLGIYLPELILRLSARVVRVMHNAACVEFYEDTDKLAILANFLYDSKTSFAKSCREDL